MSENRKNYGKKIGFVLLFSILFIGSALLLLYAIPVSHSAINRRIEQILLKELALDSCCAEKVSLKVFKGITITGLTLLKKVEVDKSIRIIIPKVTIEYRFFPAFSKVYNYKKAAHTMPGIEKRSKGAGEKKKTALSLRDRYLAFSNEGHPLFECLKTISLNDGTVSIDSLGRNRATLGGIRGFIRINKAKPFHSKMKFSIEKMDICGIKSSDNTITLAMYGPRCVIKKIEGTLFGGKASAAFDLDLMRDSITGGGMELKRIEVGDIYAAAKNAKGVLKGKCDLRMKIHPGIAGLSLLNGDGTIQLYEISAEQIPLIKRVALLTGLGKLSCIAFRRLGASFVLCEGEISSEDIEGKGDPLSLKMSGWTRNRDGYFNFNVYGIFERHYKDSVNAIVWESLFPEDKGRRSFRCKVYGTVSSPAVSLDKELAKRAVSTAIKSIEQEIKSILRHK